MKVFKLLTTLFVVACLLSPRVVTAAEVIIAADNWCPINCEPNSSSPGFMVEIAQIIFQKKGHTIKYARMPWKRSIAMARNGEINGIIGAFHGDAPDFIFPENEQVLLTNSFYVLKDNYWNFEDIESLDKLTLGCIKGYDYGTFLNNHIKTSSTNRILSIAGDDNLISRLLTLLEIKRVDVIVETDLVFSYEVEKSRKHNQFRNAGSASKPMKAYIAFSPSHPKSLEYAKILSDGMEEIRHSEEFETIMRKYGLTNH